VNRELYDVSSEQIYTQYRCDEQQVLPTYNQFICELVRLNGKSFRQIRRKWYGSNRGLELERVHPDSSGVGSPLPTGGETATRKQCFGGHATSPF